MMMRPAALRSLIAMFGLCAIAWAADVIPIYRANVSTIQTAQRILSGDRFNSSQLRDISVALAAPLSDTPLALARTSSVTVRLMLLEDRLKAEPCEHFLSDIDDLHKGTIGALTLAPTDAFMWLAAFWLNRLCGQAAENDLDLLRMSYSTGSNEGWIAIRRSPLALSMLGKLPDGLEAEALDEFVGLLRSRYYADAANVFAGPAWPEHDKLLKQVDKVDESARRAFAKAVDARGLPGVQIPVAGPRPNRPF
jgi:hypothetical protein